ncbi:short-chain dehydrogenase [Candidatus Wirthbacteria bacterium CG2_30_54_11]|uniref:Short-chain dehydrogenase n=1 Tax=Candidatus Wirthbacteria bacterium CG2_30_54_11 TaxID=1817892 RepID=A0A1J5IIH9_9BACT|nr:MAG: short-chain dehydrogenase [Candidatus Wirthbacteria bacterium CG2_30_54_11]
MTVRTALITGASRGIGKAIREAFEASGIAVLAPGRTEMDLSDARSIAAYLDSLGSRQIDILINNAGINPLGGISEITDEDIRSTIAVNLEAPLFLMRTLVPRMEKNGWGRVVNISSIWSEVSKPRRIVYSSTKAGLSAATRTIAVEVASHGVLVNAVAPGYTNTELTRQNNPPDVLAAIEQTIPQGRLAEPREIAELVLFLCSDRNSYITGQTIFIDGGFTCQ